MNNKNNHKSLLCMLISILPVALLIGLDQLSKYFAYSNLRVNGPIEIIKGVFSLTYTTNTGAAWGMMSGNVIHLWLPIILGIIIIIFYQRIPATKRMLPLNICLIFLFSGAIGNRIDRAIYGCVQDYFYFELIDFPIFNVADCYIVVSCIVTLLLFLFFYKEDEFDNIFSLKRNK